MGAKIKMMNIKKRYGEKHADIFVKSQPILRKISCPPSLNSNLIDEFLIIFLVAAKANGVSSFSNSKNLDYLPDFLKNKSIKLKKLMDGSIKVFVSVEDKKCLDILNNFVDFN